MTSSPALSLELHASTILESSKAISDLQVMICLDIQYHLYSIAVCTPWLPSTPGRAHEHQNCAQHLPCLCAWSNLLYREVEQLNALLLFILVASGDKIQLVLALQIVFFWRLVGYVGHSFEPIQVALSDIDGASRLQNRLIVNLLVPLTAKQ